MSLREGALDPFSGAQLSQNGAATLLDDDDDDATIVVNSRLLLTLLNLFSSRELNPNKLTR